MSRSFILTLSCPDRIGIVAAVATFLAERQGNIRASAQFDDRDSGSFFMRVNVAF
jgi:formyltetrahydrofolate deformylase